MFEEHIVSAVEAAKRTIRCWTLRGKLKATTYSSTLQIALANLDHFVATRSPDVQASQAQRLTELEHRVFLPPQSPHCWMVSFP